MNKSTLAQQRAIEASGNLLVVAGAGTGKTRTLVQRCVAWLFDEKNQGSLDEILMVTFTEAAAAEMRQRLRAELEKINLQRADPRLAEQLALLDVAQICTLHSFCLRLVRAHFHELELDPELSVLADEQTQLLARESLDAVLEKHYRGDTPIAAAVQELIQKEGRGWDQPVRDLIGRVHAYTQTLPQPDAWFETQEKIFQNSNPQDWEKWLIDALHLWRGDWLKILLAQPAENVNAHQCAAALQNLRDESSREEFSVALAQILEAEKVWPARKKGVFSAPIKTIFEDANFFQSLCVKSQSDPLVEDWNWVRPQMMALLQLAREFEETFSRAKRELAGIDFHDLEQFALRLLWDTKTNRPTAVAEKWRKKFRQIFVDEYQDINAAQDAIIRALAGEGADANRFLVGDVKQSIYRFRLADPRIFLRYQRDWGAERLDNSTRAFTSAATPTEVIPLSHNFRSHEAILNFVNPLFAALMRQEIGGVDYDEPAKLQFGAPQKRAHLSVAADSATRVELHLRLADPSEDDAETETENSDWESLSTVEKEARLIASRLRELKNQATLVWDKDNEGKEIQRPVTWSDMVILLRSPRGKAEAYAKEFARLGMPLAAARGGFFESLEVSDLLSLLQLIDNPLQDLPLLAVLRSPLAGLSADELAAIRLASRKGNFWTALVRWHESESPKSKVQSPNASGIEKVGKFLTRFAHWRRWLRQVSLSQLLENVLDETHFSDWLLAQTRGGQRQANVERLLQLTRQFDVFQGEGLYRFLRFVQTQQENEIDAEPARAEGAEVVRLMSIHQSKGLEFPIVVVADLAKRFNFSDANANVILDEEFGLCPRVRPPQTQQRYPSLPHWLAQRRQKRETLGEELRLLYVALTRASERLILVGTTRRKTIEEKWPDSVAGGFGLAQISSGKSYLDWLGGWLAHENGAAFCASGKINLLSWTIHEEAFSSATETAGDDEESEQFPSASAPELEQLKARLEWNYSHESATRETAKSSVSLLRRRVREDVDEEARPLFKSKVQSPKSKLEIGDKLSAAQIGSAHHTFLELVSLPHVGTLELLKVEAVRLQSQQLLSAQEIGALNFPALLAFWQSEVGQQILARREKVERELAFTARFSAADLAQLNLLSAPENLAGEFIVVQGVIDLAVILPDEIWLLDFKTDHFDDAELPEKINLYQPQLALYAAAISRIYTRPVTKRWLHFLAKEKTVALS